MWYISWEDHHTLRGQAGPCLQWRSDRLWRSRDCLTGLAGGNMAQSQAKLSTIILLGLACLASIGRTLSSVFLIMSRNLYKSWLHFYSSRSCQIIIIIHKFIFYLDFPYFHRKIQSNERPFYFYISVSDDLASYECYSCTVLNEEKLNLI